MNQNIEEAKALAAKWLREDEDFSIKPYADPRGDSLRIGYGSACPDGMTECPWVTAERMMAATIEVCAQDVCAYLGHGKALGFRRARLAVLYCMSYQMGYSGMCSFQKMQRAIFQGDFAKAADEMLDSAWRKQTPERCERLALIMQRGSD